MSLAAAHVVAEPGATDPVPTRPTLRAVDRLVGWADVVTTADEPCLMLDAEGVVTAVSPSCLVLLGVGAAAGLVGRGLLDDVVELVDFTASRGRLLDSELDRIPPLLALRSGGLARGLMRVQVVDSVRTIDAVSTPLRAGSTLLGSLTFFTRV